MTLIEYELTYLAKYIPKEIGGIKPDRLVDYYLPETGVDHPNVRVRSRGGKYEITKKWPLDGFDSSEQAESTIELSEQEYDDLASSRKRVISKNRYKVEIQGHPAEVDIFTGELSGLVLIDFEFKSSHTKDAFSPPNCCLKDVSQQEFLAGGFLAGKSYRDIEKKLYELGYKKLSL